MAFSTLRSLIFGLMLMFSLILNKVGAHQVVDRETSLKLMMTDAMEWPLSMSAYDGGGGGGHEEGEDMSSGGLVEESDDDKFHVHLALGDHTTLTIATKLADLCIHTLEAALPSLVVEDDDQGLFVVCGGGHDLNLRSDQCH
ncbi:hypothetical protein QYF36_015338 [Acer negundo]|nr:hypothetical protein QYF36_015338 [Acer negundo]